MSGYSGPIIDVDIHHAPQAPQELIEYLPKRWQEYVRADGREQMSLLPFGCWGTVATFGHRSDAWDDDGTQPGTNVENVRTKLLDRYGYYRGILTHQLGQYGTHQNQYFAQAICQAANDWTLERWLSRDERLFALISIPAAVPEHAVAEIRRLGSNPRFVGVLLCGNPFGRPIGDPLFHPIYQVATEMGLAISVHPATSDRPNQLTAATGGPLGFMDHVSQFTQQAQHYISSLVVHGVFEKFPTLRFTIKEYGIAWLPSVLWRLDQNYELLKQESPWVKRLPSEYLHEHVKLSTQPIEESPDDKKGLARLLETFDGIEDMLCFSSDYPHGSMDAPDFIGRQLPASWLRKVFCDNACLTYGWSRPPETYVRPDAAMAATT
jgi:uncharacterized protein